MPTDDDFIFIVFPGDTNDGYDGPHIYEHGELRPLITDDNDDKSETEASEPLSPSQQPTDGAESASGTEESLEI